MSRMAVRKQRLEGTGCGSADQPEHWAWMDRSKMADGPRCAEFKGKEALAKEALAKDALVKDALAKEALARRPLVR
jgi:hypothetical protein